MLKVSRSLRPGRGSVVKMEVADSSGEIQVSTFDAVDELFARVKKGKAVQVHPLLHDPAFHSTFALHPLYAFHSADPTHRFHDQSDKARMKQQSSETALARRIWGCML